MSTIIAWLFGCAHKNFTFPQTDRKRRRTHVACLGCGQEFNYSWAEMRIVQEVQKAPMVKKRAPVIEIGEFRRIARIK